MKALRVSLCLIWLLLALGGLVSAGDDASQGEIVINEFMADPDANAGSDYDGEWIELFNVTGSAINIDGWTLSDAGTNHLIDNGGTLSVAPGDYVLLCRNATSSQNGGIASCAYEYSSVSLNNSGDSIILQDEGGETIAQRDYPSSDVTTGASTFYIPSDQPPASGYYTDQQDDDQWAETDTSSGPTYGDGDYGTPGSKNTQPGSPDTPTAVTFIQLGGQSPVRWASFSVLGLLLGGLLALRCRRQPSVD